MSTKYLFISGGVISGVGKGITTASISLLLKARGFRVAPVKCDAYVNIDAGTIRPQEHGEIFVCDDGIETDQDLGHYERFLDESLSRANYITTGQIYQEVIRRERAFEYQGEDVEVVPHIPEEMIRRFQEAGEKMKAEIIIVEIGGTVGEYQNILFIEANRILKVKNKDDVLHLHVSYLPTPPSLGEMKSKPVQTSVKLLNETGVMPDFIIGRATTPLDKRRKERLALFCNVDIESIISSPDVTSIYETPLILERQQLAEKILKKLGLKPKIKKDLQAWKQLVKRIEKLEKTPTRTIKIGIVGKYQKVGDFKLEDTYISVVEAIKHAAWRNGVRPEILWFDSEKIEKTGPPKELAKVDGFIIPQGWGSRGVEGKIKAVQYAREKKIPYLGLCFGMQMAIIEFLRNVCGLKNANSTEVDPKTPHPVIHIMPDQKKYLKKHQYGGTIRLGTWSCKIKKGTLLSQSYKNQSTINNQQLTISERHRHRYEVNNEYREKLTKGGLVISGISPDGKLVEAIELPKEKHPFFVGTQFHPEYQSRPLNPHPLFVQFIKAVKQGIKKL